MLVVVVLCHIKRYWDFLHVPILGKTKQECPFCKVSLSDWNVIANELMLLAASSSLFQRLLFSLCCVSSRRYSHCCLFVCLERALARIPTLHRPVEWHKPAKLKRSPTLSYPNPKKNNKNNKRVTLWGIDLAEIVPPRTIVVLQHSCLQCMLHSRSSKQCTISRTACRG